MAVIRNLVVKITADISALQKGLEDAQSHLSKVSKNFTSIGKTLTAGITAPLAGMGALAIKTASDFEQSMANAASVSGATAEEFERMKEVAREMGKSTVFSAKDAADAMYYMASAGYKAEQMAQSIKPILDLAAATQSDLAFSTDTVIAALNQFGLKASDAGRVSNVFAAAIGASQATMDKLSYSMRYVGPVANSLGYSIEQTTAALGLLYNAGFQGEQAGTILRGALSRLMKPTKEVNEALKEMGLTYDQVNPAARSIADIVKVLGDHSITTAQAVAIFGQEAGPGMMALISQGSGALADMESKISGTNAAADMAQKQIDTFQGSMKLLKSALEEVAIQLGNIIMPILRDFVTKYIQPAVEWFSNLDDGTKKAIITIAALVAAIGPLFLAIGGITQGLSAAAGALSMLLSPAGLVIAAVLALATAILYLWDTNEGFRNAVTSAWEGIKAAFASVWQALAPVRDMLVKTFENMKAYGAPVIETLRGLFADLQSALAAFWQFIKPIASFIASMLVPAFAMLGGVINGLLNALGPLANAFVSTIRFVIDVLGVLFSLLTGDFAGAGEFLQKALGSLGDAIMSIFTTVWEFIKGFAEGFIAVFKSLGIDIPAMVSGMVQVVSGWFTSLGQGITNIIGGLSSFLLSAWNSIASAVTSIVSGLVNGITALFTGFAGAVQGIWSGLTSIVSGIVQGFTDFVIGCFEWLYQHNYYFQALVDFIKVAFESIAQFTSQVWQGITSSLAATWQAIYAAAQSAWNAISGMFNVVLNAIKGAFTAAWGGISAFLSGLWNGIRNTALAVWNGITAVFRSVLNTITGVFNSMEQGASAAWNGMISAITSAGSCILKAVGGVFASIRGFITNIIKEAFNWGANLIGSIIDGIRSMIGKAGEAAKNVASKIASFLGFHSPAKEGPGAQADHWMPNLMNMLAQGVQQYTPKLQAALDMAMAAPALDIPIQGIQTPAPAASPININIASMVVRSDEDIYRISRELNMLIQSAQRSRGVR